MGAVVSGAFQQWNAITIDFDGPFAIEEAATFRNYRLDVTFTSSDTGTTITVPGFFAADGDAANTSATSGDVWRVKFTPPEVGSWSYAASFRTGTDIAASLDPSSGTPVSDIDGITGSFAISPSDKGADDLRAKGALEYDGDHYLTFAGTDENLIKSGVGGPENFLEYVGFDNTPKDRHDYDAHISDWNAGDPTWGDDLGKGIIGAVNYLADQGVNSFYMMVNSIGGDARSVGPWAAENLDDVPRGPAGVTSGGTHDISGFEDAFSVFDVSKLAQWGIVFEHMQAKGLVINMMLAERENDQLLNNGALGVERAIYLREIIARFGHNNGLIYNFGEENTNTYENIRDMSAYIRAVDGYDRPLAWHVLEFQQDPKYRDLAPEGVFDVFSNHQWATTSRQSLETWYDYSDQIGRPMPNYWDEQFNGGAGLRPDTDPDQQATMRVAFWGTLTVGGAGAEWYPGGEDLTWDDFSTRENAFLWAKVARELFEVLPVDDMEEQDQATTAQNDFVFANLGEIYVVYLENGGTTSLDLSAYSGDYDVLWYNPRLGGLGLEGSVSSVAGGGVRGLGTPPADTATIPGTDWVVIIRKAGAYPLDGIDPPPANVAPNLTAPASVEVTEGTVDVTILSATDSDGDPISFAITGGEDAAFFILDPTTGVLTFETPPDFESPQDADGNNSYEVEVAATDDTTGIDSATISVEVANDPADDPGTPITVILVDADTDLVIGALEEGTEFAAADVAGRQLSIYAVVPDSSPLFGSVGSMKLDFNNGAAKRTESVSPYALFGDSGGDFFPGVALQSGSHSIVFEIFSNPGGKGTLLDTVSIDFSVAEAAPNTPPLAGDDTASVAEEGSLFGIDVLANDVDPDGNLPLEVTQATAQNGTVTIEAGFTLQYTPDADFAGTDTVTYAVRDAQGGTDEGVLTVTVTPVNDAPVAVDDVAVTSAGMAVGLDVLSNDSDVDGPVLSIAEIGTPANGSAEIVDGEILYTPFAEFSGTDSFTYDVTDGSATAQASVTVTVLVGNRPPSFTSPAAVSVTENATTVSTVAASDPDGNALSFAIAGGADAAQFMLNAETGLLTFVSPPDFEMPADANEDNVFELTVRANDGTASVTQDVEVTVTDMDETVSLPIDIQLVDADSDTAVAQLVPRGVVDLTGLSGASFSIVATLPEGSPLAGSVGSMRLNLNSGEIIQTESVAPYALFGDMNGDIFGGVSLTDGSYSVLFEVFSGARGKGSLIDTIAVDFSVINADESGPSNSAPELIGPTEVGVLEGDLAVVDFGATDADGDPLSFSISGGTDAAFFSIDPNTGSLRLNAALDFEAPLDAGGDNVYDVEVSVSDGRGGVDEQSLSVTILNDESDDPSNTPPELFGPTSVNVEENSTAVALFSGFDADADDFVFGIQGTDSNAFEINAMTGALSFASAPDFEAPIDFDGDNAYDAFVFVTDGEDSAGREVTVTVTDVDESATPAIDVFLVDVDTQEVFSSLTDGAVFSAADAAGRSFSIYAEAATDGPLDGNIGSMSIDFDDGAQVRTENVAPYALFGDSAGEFFGGVAFEARSYSIDFDVYSGRGGFGELLDSASYVFDFV